MPQQRILIGYEWIREEGKKWNYFTVIWTFDDNLAFTKMFVWKCGKHYLVRDYNIANEWSKHVYKDMYKDQ